MFIPLIFIACLVLNSINAAPLKTTRTPTLLISLDGFRADKLDEFLRDNPGSNFEKEFVNLGVKAQYMQPSFPSLTFPNHFTLVTGLYPESQGIIGNKAYDPNFDEKVNFLDRNDANRFNPKWWNNTEPIWLSAKNQDLKTVSLFWTGSEVWTRHPDVFKSYDIYSSRYSFQRRCELIADYFEKFNLDFATLYYNEPDETGHNKGPNSEEYRLKIIEIDQTIGYLVQLLKDKNLYDHMNIVVVSDHGMAEMGNITYIVKDYVDPALIDAAKSYYGIVANIFPVNDADLETIYLGLKRIPNFNVYYKKDIPDKYNFKNSPRIAPIVAVADESYVLNTVRQTLKGNHGFNNSITSMRSIFMARGPDFKQNVKIDSLNNVDVYPLLCNLIKINCKPNNGSMNPFMNVLSSSSLNYALTQLKFD